MLLRAFDAALVARLESFFLSTAQPLRLLAREPRFLPSARSAAVLVPLVNDMGVPSILFTVRSTKVPTHKGQVAFPGGHMKPGEGPVDAALRETIEEIGPGIGSVHVLGCCQTVPAVTGARVTPVVGWVTRDVERCRQLTLCPNEVESAFTVPVEFLLDPRNRDMETLGKRGDMPVFAAPPHRIWGLTAFITDGVLRRALVPALAAEEEAQRRSRPAAIPDAHDEDSSAAQAQ